MLGAAKDGAPIGDEGDADERPGFVADRHVIAFRQSPARVAVAAGALRQMDQLVGSSEREIGRRHGTLDGEYRGRRANAEGERDDRRRGESGTPAQLAHGVAKVLREIVEQAQADRIAHVVLVPLDSAERRSCHTAGLVRRHPAANELRGFHLDVEAHLVVHVALALRALDERPELPPENHVASRTCSMASENRRQSARSPANCFRPAAVSV